MADPQFMLAQDLENLRDILEEKASPEEVQQRPKAADVQSGVVAFLTLGAGLALLGIGFILLLRRLGGGGGADSSEGNPKAGPGSAESDRKFRFIIEF